MDSSRPPNEVLEGWKAIAGYLGRSTRTAQRWKKRDGLPVHKHDRLGTVAYKSELDGWLKKFPPEDASSAKEQSPNTEAVPTASAAHEIAAPLTDLTCSSEPRLAALNTAIAEANIKAESVRNRDAARSPIGRLPIAITGCLITIALGTAVFFDRPLEIISFEQLTNDGFQKIGPILSDGQNLFFEAFMNNRWVPVTTPRTGGALVPVSLPFPSARILDISPNTHEFLLSTTGDSVGKGLWAWRPAGSLKKLDPMDAASATWLKMPTRFAETTASRLRIIDKRSVTTIPTAGHPLYPRWTDLSSELRFSQWNPKTEQMSLWELRVGDRVARLVAGQPGNSCCGSWTPDASFFLFQVGSRRQAEVWAMHERLRWLPHRHPAAFRLATGPVGYQWPTPDSDGKSFFVIGESQRGTLVIKKETTPFQPFVGGISGIDLNWCRNGELIAYSSFPLGTLWRMDKDGNHKLQMTHPPLKVSGPHWSPDCQTIAFMGRSVDGRSRVYVMPAKGGLPKLAMPDSKTDQGIPTWSPNGSRLMFGELQYRKPADEMEISVLDIRTGRVVPLSARKGLWTPRWSPDGRWVVAMTPNFTKLLLFDMNSGSWAEIISMRSIDDPAWTADSRYIHFRALDDSIPHNDTVLALYRFDISSRKLERLVSLRDVFPSVATEWFGITPDGAPLALWNMGIQEIYRARLDH